MLPRICTEELEEFRENKTGRGVSDREGLSKTKSKDCGRDGGVI